MKTITTLILVAVIMLTSCQKQLDLKPKKIYAENFYQTPEDAASAINAVYDVLGQVGQYNSNLWLMQDVGSDDCNTRPTINDPNLHELGSYNIRSTNNYVAGVWQSSYLGILRANIVLDKIPDIEMDSAAKNVILGQAYFMRGLFYFNLVRMFGDVPLVLVPPTNSLSNDELYLPRISTNLVYDQIIEDLEMAGQWLPTVWSGDSDKGRATKGAALGILSKVYLTMQQWGNASLAANQVIELGSYSLWPDFAFNFKEASANGIESVFEIQFYRNVISENSRIVISGLPSIPGLFSSGVEIMIPTLDLIESYEEGDYRKEVSFFDEYWFYEFEPHIWKHWDREAYEPDQTGQSGANFTVMRYAEILLIYAEALNEKNGDPTAEAYAAINLVRERARNGNPDVLPDLSGLSQGQFRDAVLKERRCEFVNEGIRWFDLIRTGTLIEAVKRAKGDNADPKPYNYLFPIPQREMDVNKNLVQNPGY